MKQHIPLKSALRQPAQTLFLLLLIAAISFAFIARAVEYIVVDRETERIGMHYRAVGQFGGQSIDEEMEVVAQEAFKRTVVQAADIIAKSPYVDFEDRRRSCAGVMHGIYNNKMDSLSLLISDRLDGLFDFNGLYLTDMFLYGKLVRMEYDEDEGYGKLAFIADKVEEGLPAYEALKAANKRYSVQLRQEYAGSAENIQSILAGLKPDTRYFIKICFDQSDVVGNSAWAVAKPLNDEGLFFAEVAENAELDFTAPPFSALPEEIAILRENLHTVEVISTKDASAMPRMQPASQMYFLVLGHGGRWIDYNDYLNANRVCMVEGDFAYRNGLSQGDMLTLTLRDIDSDAYRYITDEHLNAWRSYPTHEETFEIVGMYKAKSQSLYSYIYIPESCMPQEFDRFEQEKLKPYNYSFTLKSAKDVNAFADENQGAIEALGLSLNMIDGGAAAFWEAVAPIKRSTAFNAQLFGAVLLLALLLATFIYMRLRRREFAILRALGRPKSACIRQALGPITLLGGAGVSAGGLLAWDFAREKALQTLATLKGPKGVESSAELSILWLCALCGAILIALVLLSLIGAQLLARRPVLELLQGVAAKQKGAQKKAVASKFAEAASGEQPQKAYGAVAMPTLKPVIASDKKRTFAAALGYVLKHALRAPLKSTLTLMLALCFIASLGWMDLTVERGEAEIEHLYTSAEVGMDIVSLIEYNGTGPSGFIYKKTVDAVLQSGFVKSYYLVADLRYPRLASKAKEPRADGLPYDDGLVETGNLLLQSSTDLGAYFSGTEQQIKYLPGHDIHSFSTYIDRNFKEIPILVPASRLEALEANIGDIIYYISTDGWYAPCRVYGKIGETGEDVELIERLVNSSTPDVVPLSAIEYLKKQTYGGEIGYSVASFELEPAKNRELPAFKETIRSLLANPKAGTLPLTAVFWDDSLANAVAPMEKNLQLLSVLFPVTVALSAVIAAGLSVLLLLQSAKEAAVLRVLGNTRRRVWAMLCAEQLLLTLLGLILGLAVLALVRSGMPDLLTSNALLCALIYLGGALIGSVFTAASVVRKMPIALLQVKE